MSQCFQVAPQTNIADKPDAFSDGSSTHPKLPQFGIATAAVWWPGRSLSASPLTQLEITYGHIRELQGGVTVAAHLEGYDPSSTRAELLGLIFAIFSPMTCRLAIDSAATLHRAWRIQDWLARHISSFSARLSLSVNDTLQPMPLGKNYNLCTNGDLWHTMHRQLLHRGPNTVIFVKTKGHEDPSFLRRFSELRQEALGNDQADKAARHARSICFNPNVIRLSDVLAERTEKYTLFMKHVHAIITRVHEVPQALRKTPAFTMDPERRGICIGDRVLHTRPTLPPDLHFAPLRAKASTRLVSIHLNDAGPLIVGFAQLLSHHSFAASPHCAGFTWLELLLLSIAASPNLASIYISNNAAPTKKLAHLL